MDLVSDYKNSTLSTNTSFFYAIAVAVMLFYTGLIVHMQLTGAEVLYRLSVGYLSWYWKIKHLVRLPSLFSQTYILTGS